MKIDVDAFSAPVVNGAGARLRDEPSHLLRSRIATSVPEGNAHRKHSSTKPAIPAKLHYVWFGEQPMSDEMRETLEEWSRLMPGHEVIRWDETNLDVDSHSYMKRMHRAGKYAFASDYARLLILLEHGGIYLDTDVRMKKSIAPFANEQCFWSFEFDHFISTAVIGSRPGHPFIKLLLEEYDHLDEPMINNVLVTRAFIREFPEFRLNNKDQVVGGDIRIFPKEYMVIPSFDKEQNFSVHLAYNQWRSNGRRIHWGRMAKAILGEVIFYKIVNLKLRWSSDLPALERARRKN